MKYFLIMLVFVSGMSSLAMEMCASRFLAAYFGTSIYVWTIVISLILFSLTIGYFLGGKLADYYPHKQVLCMITAVASVSMSIIAFVAQGVFSWSMTLPRQYLLSIFINDILFFAFPVALLGCVSPFAIRLLARKVVTSGRISGSFYAISTVGSIIGVFLPALWLIPAYGVRRTMLMFAVVLFAASLWGLRPRWRPTFLLTLIPFLLSLVLSLGPLRTVPHLIYEEESYYNYIQVTQTSDGTRRLLINEDSGIHSFYNPKTILTNEYWDDFLVAPYLTEASPAKDTTQEPPHIHRVCIIGLAGGTVARQFTSVYNAVPIDGVELDPATVRIGQKYFGMTEPNLHISTEDGRTFLSTTQMQYDLVAVDAYQQLYIPFHLATKEFFTLIRSHLSPSGAVAINVIHGRSDYRLVEAFINTMHQVFPAIYQINVAGTFNTVLMATLAPTSVSAFRASLARLTPTTTIGQVAYRVIPSIQQGKPHGSVVFTDDQAPVEQMTDQLTFSP